MSFSTKTLKTLDLMRVLWYNRGKIKRRKRVLQMTEKLPNNLEEALAFIQKLQTENTELHAEKSELKATVDKQNIMLSNLNEMLVKGRKAMFGKSSEQLGNIEGSEQLSLFNEAEQEYSASASEPTVETVMVKSHPRKKRLSREELPESVERKKVVIDLDDKKCPECGEEMVCIGEEFVRSELNIIPAQISVIDYYQKKYKCKKCEDDNLETSIVKPDLPVPVIKKSMASAGTIAYVIQQKYQLGTPLYRQEQYWKAQGIELNRTTLANWIIRSSKWNTKLWERMMTLLLKEPVIHADETVLRVLKRDGKHVDGQSRCWVFCSGKDSEHKMSLYLYHPTRSAKVVEEVLGGYSGYLQTDGYSAYNAAVNAKRLGCWSHARRKWVECLPKGIEDKNSKAAQALELVEQIFAEEKRLEGLPKDEVHEQRLKHVKPILERYWKLLENISAVGGSNLDKAVNYSLNNKIELENFLLDGRLELTNNRAERAVKPFVMGRKNWLFSDTNKGADASMMWYSVIESAKLNGLNVYGYLLHLLTELPKLGEFPTDEQLDSFMPWTKLPDFCK